MKRLCLRKGLLLLVKSINSKRHFREKMYHPSQQDGNLTLVCFRKLDRKTSMHIKRTRDRGKRKALRMFQSRRMKSIKVFKTGDGELYVKASVLKSFSMEVTHTVTVLFNSNAPRKAYCECPVGNCGLCCHAILVLLQLKHFTLHKELLLALTCTQKLQRWHCPTTGKTSVKVKAASHIRLKYFRNIPSARKAIMHKRSEKKVEGLPENHKDWDKSDWLTRDVCEISSKVEDRLKQQTNVDI